MIAVVSDLDLHSELIDVVPATADRWSDIETLLGGQGERGCWCQYWRQSSSDYSHLGPGSGRRALRAQLGSADPLGVLAYIGREPVGWCGLGRRSRLERLVRSRTIPKIDELDVWSIVCFLVRPGYRRRGVARALLDGAVDYARTAGAPAIEAYPVDSGTGRVDSTFGYVGFVPMFEAAGFRRIVETDARSDHRPRVLMRRVLDGAGARRSSRARR